MRVCILGDVKVVFLMMPFLMEILDSIKHDDVSGIIFHL